ncbi:MAG: MFS transporter [Anaerolineae bacterium]
MATENTASRTLWGFSSKFWLLVTGTLINSTGSALVFPFIALYLGRRFGATEAETGLFFTFYAVVSLFSGAAGGALSDRFGRKGVMVIGLVSAIVFSVIFAFSTSLLPIIIAVLINGLLGPVFGPAANAMVADMLPETQLQRGYGLIRVAANLGVVVGPMLGGLLADTENGFMWLFLGDALTSGLFALLIVLFLPETRPESAEAGEADGQQAGFNLFAGYGRILRDTPFVLFSLTFLAASVVYSQMNTNLVLYLEKEFGISTSQYSYLIALNAAMVVLFQFPITAYIERFNKTNLLAIGTLCYAIGFGMYGFVGAMWWFALAMAILTLGEMILIPVAQAVVAETAPEDMRGRYMGFYGLVWGLSFGIGPLAGGMILSAQGGLFRRYLWYASLVIGLIGAGSFLLLGRYMKRRSARLRWQALHARYSTTSIMPRTGISESAITGKPIVPGRRN